MLYVNETRGAWDRANLTQSETPLHLAFDTYNPKPYPYTITKVGYTIRMNDVTVGEGAPSSRQTRHGQRKEKNRTDSASLTRWSCARTPR
ncbi:hypothetical protein [Haloarcula sp. Atlit-120R]|uniref:hypothetical protein n=1 Tax=Haloarcula sp. Atlit-120R TaxID=2282135 RepID=UPI001F15C195|nr:hypothetical protein [Haloarcula sp. Atlit-120R]